MLENSNWLNVETCLPLITIRETYPECACAEHVPAGKYLHLTSLAAYSKPIEVTTFLQTVTY